MSINKQKLGLPGWIIASLLVVISHGVCADTVTDENSLENRLKEFNAPEPKLAKYVKKSKPKKVVAKKSRASLRKTKIVKTKRKRYKRACYQSSASTLLERAESFQPSITDSSRRYGVSEALIISVITAESCFAKRARSPKNARGLMQLIPATAKRFGVRNSYIPSENIKGGTRYLKFLLKRFSGNLHLVLAAYNAGEGAVDRYSGIPPYRETKEYVRRVMSVYRRLQDSNDYKDLVTGQKAVLKKTSINNYNTPVRFAKSSSGKGYFIKPDFKWKRKSKSSRPSRVSRLYNPPKKAKRSGCRDVSSQKLRRTSRLSTRGKTMKRYYSARIPKSLSSIARETGVSLNLLLRMNRGASKYMVKAGSKVLVWQCARH